MEDRVLDDIATLIPPLLRSLEALAFIARHFDPPAFADVMDAAGTPDTDLRDAHDAMADWPARFEVVRGRLDRATEAALSGFDGLRAADDVRSAFRALRFLPRAEEALYPLAPGLPSVSRYFLPLAQRDDASLLPRLAAGGPDSGIFHINNDPGSRGGFSLYVPELYTPERPAPVVMALHGGSGNGRGFLWNWLRDARAAGAVLIAPTATGPTWALNGPDADTPNLRHILEQVRSRLAIDPSRMLLTGMSDGGTFSYVSGLEPASPFTHLAPVSASFHPMLARMADAERMRGLPIHIVHGTLDWMFPVEIAHSARDALTAAGAAVRYREVEDLSHTYPRDINPELLDWLGA